eukprot:CAMPEP_0185040742 /NCGR_PEP_ID=MMETSP1103-20130426/39172_1 /TAXON_ID=36769 /ORGANISM="Paraphysomonas bandaiensis, Strain Caron Lab Isolate" /LENGTH=960 /DNA_ID=CAMNT_0027580157 /DNA_START=179 /DNA_END=3058 /DNA_ORIENTATION=+
MEYYRCSIDVSAVRGDIITVQSLLQMSLHNISDGTVSKGVHEKKYLHMEISPQEELLSFALAKFTRHGHSDKALELWAAFGKKSGLQRKYTENIIRKSFSGDRASDFAVLNEMHEVMKLNVWNQNFNYYNHFLVSMRNCYMKTLGTCDIDSITAEMHSKISPTLSSLTSLYDESLQNVPRCGSDVLQLMNVQYMLLKSEYQSMDRKGHHNQEDTYSKAKETFTELSMRRLSMKKTTGREDSESGACDSGDVVSYLRDPNSAMSSFESGINRIIDRELNCSSKLFDTASKMGMNRGYIKLLSEIHRGMLLHSPPHGGADIGANYGMNVRMESTRVTLMMLLREITKRDGVGTLMSYLSLFLQSHSHKKCSKGGRSKESIIPESSFDDSVSPNSSTITSSLLTRASAEFCPNENSKIKRHHPFYRASRAHFNGMLLSSSPKYVSDIIRRENGEDNPVYKTHLPEENALKLYSDIGLHLKETIALSEKCGIELNSQFFSNWILALPLIDDETDERMGWCKSLPQVMRIRDYALSYGCHASDGILNHAVMCHLLSYRSLSSFHFATHWLLDVSKDGVILPRTWNMLLTCALLLPSRDNKRIILEQVMSECRSEVSMPYSREELHYRDVLRRGEVVDDSLLDKIILSKGITHGESVDERSNQTANTDLAMAVLNANIQLRNGSECLRTMKFLHLCGTTLPSKAYRGIIDAISRCVEHRDPLQSYISMQAELIARLLYPTMRRDGVKVDEAMICKLLTLFSYPAKINTKRANRYGKVDSESTRQEYFNAKAFMQFCCENENLAVSVNMVEQLVSILYIGNLHQLAESQLHSLIDEYNLAPSCSLFVPLHNHYCHELKCINSVERLFKSMNRKGVAIGQTMMDDLLELWAQFDDTSDRRSMSQLIEEYGGVYPSSEALDRMLEFCLVNGDEKKSNDIASILLQISGDNKSYLNELKQKFKTSNVGWN